MGGHLVEPCTDAGVGLSFEDDDVVVFNRTGNGATSVEAGALVAFCFLNSTTITGAGEASVSVVPGARNSVFANITRTLAASDCQASFFGVALENILGNAKGKVRVRGLVKANVFHTSNSAVPSGFELVANNTKSGYLDALGQGVTPTVQRKILGITAETLSGTTSTGGQIMVLFDGINGFGSANG